MPESYVIVPADSTGKQLRTWTGSTNVNAAGVHSEAVVLTIADAANTFIDPRLIRISGSAWLIASYLNVLNSTPQGTKTGSFCLRYKYT